ncbi:hypothetical protein ACFL6Y_09435 [Elusimicrobiota bacterium]
MLSTTYAKYCLTLSIGLRAFEIAASFGLAMTRGWVALPHSSLGIY